jgi:hypothetical protein
LHDAHVFFFGGIETFDDCGHRKVHDEH